MSAFLIVIGHVGQVMPGTSSVTVFVAAQTGADRIEDGKVIFQCKDKDSGQEVMTLRDVAIVLGKTQKEVYGMIGNRAKQTASVLGVKSLPVFRIPGSKQYGILRSDFFAWLRSLPAPIHIHKGRNRKPKQR